MYCVVVVVVVVVVVLLLLLLLFLDIVKIIPQFEKEIIVIYSICDIKQLREYSQYTDRKLKGKNEFAKSSSGSYRGRHSETIAELLPSSLPCSIIIFCLGKQLNSVVHFIIEQIVCL